MTRNRLGILQRHWSEHGPDFGLETGVWSVAMTNRTGRLQREMRVRRDLMARSDHVGKQRLKELWSVRKSR